MDIMHFITTAILVFCLKLGIDILQYFKNEAFTKSNKILFITMHLAEAMYWVLLYKIILEAIKESYIFLPIFGLGAFLSAFVQTHLKTKFDDKIHGQRKFFVRITIIEPEMLDPIVTELTVNGYELALTEKQLYTNGKTHTVITGSLENRKQMNEIKNILRNKKGFHVVFLRAEDIYVMS